MSQDKIFHMVHLHIDLSKKYHEITFKTQEFILQQVCIIWTKRQISFSDNLEMSTCCNKVFKLTSLFSGPKFDLKI